MSTCTCTNLHTTWEIVSILSSNKWSNQSDQAAQMPFESIDEICGRPTLALVHVSFSPWNSSSLKRRVSKSAFSGKQFIHVRLFPRDRNSKQRQQSSHTSHVLSSSAIFLHMLSIHQHKFTTRDDMRSARGAVRCLALRRRTRCKRGLLWSAGPWKT